MRAVWLTAIRRMELGQAPDPQVERADDVRIRVEAVGICGSDVHYYAEGGIGAARVQFPHIVGHEFGGIVEAVGAAVTRVRPGDRVAVDPAIPCGACDQCRAGRFHTCRHCVFRSFPGQAAGALSDYIVMPERCCFRTRPETSADLAALCEPLSVGLHAVRLHPGTLAGLRIAILGAGPIGLSVLFAARAAGAEDIAVSDKLAYRAACAAACGAAWTGAPAALDARERAGAESCDAVFECSGDPAALEQAFRLLRPGGRLLIVGIPPVARIDFSVDDFRRKELTVTYVRRQNECMQAALDLVESGRFPVERMITHHYPLDRTPEAFDTVSRYADGAIKAIVTL